MSDFSDKEDVQLFRFAKKFVDAKQRVSWAYIEKKMKFSKKSRVVLRERFRTLRRTYGDDLDKFPRRYKVRATGREDETKLSAQDARAVAQLLQLFSLYKDDNE